MLAVAAHHDRGRADGKRLRRDRLGQASLLSCVFNLTNTVVGAGKLYHPGHPAANDCASADACCALVEPRSSPLSS